ncbi:hypothetical protein LC603019_00926 [Lawsonella clevelandensis]|uniref:Uncharacterized protein n=1 Tax=Lawsonella clevelandensis TaxID=1528099 RepID=A0A5E3ZYI2_9ACTN|nr:hypothetical protein LC603019_00926 [Lawsonella clevelandensis]
MWHRRLLDITHCHRSQLIRTRSEVESDSGAEMLVVEVADAGFFEVGGNPQGVDADVAPGEDF